MGGAAGGGGGGAGAGGVGGVDPGNAARAGSGNAGDGGGALSVTIHSVTPVPVFGWGLACAIPGGGERDGDVTEHGYGEGGKLSGDVDVRCSLPGHWLPRGAAFTVVEVHATSAGEPGKGHHGNANAPKWAVGPGMQLEIFRAPAVISVYPSLGALGGGGVVWARSADLVVEAGYGFPSPSTPLPHSFSRQLHEPPPPPPPPPPPSLFAPHSSVSSSFTDNV